MSNQEKGVLFNGPCNRTDCQKPGAQWYNHSTKMYYCTACAKMINQVNRTDALRMFGHDLCTLGDQSITVVEATDNVIELLAEIDRLKEKLGEQAYLLERATTSKFKNEPY